MLNDYGRVTGVGALSHLDGLRKQVKGTVWAVHSQDIREGMYRW